MNRLAPNYIKKTVNESLKKKKKLITILFFVN